MSFTWAPSYGAALKVKPRVRVAKFGDGYAQRAADGINNKPRAWALVFGKRTESEIDAIEAFLLAAGGDTAFDWTPPRGAAGRWVCPEWDRNLDGFNNERLTATFEEVFGA